MKNKIGVLLVLLLTLFTVACNQEPSKSGQQEIPTEQASKVVDKGVTPAESSEFVKDGVFKGGAESNNYTLNGIRKRPNSEATRIHMNFGITPDNTKSGEPPVLADKLPLFEISYQDSKRELTAIFKNVKWDVRKEKIQTLKDQAQIIKEIKFENRDGNLYVVFTLKEPVSFRLLDSEQPAGISILIKPEGNV